MIATSVNTAYNISLICVYLTYVNAAKSYNVSIRVRITDGQRR